MKGCDTIMLTPENTLLLVVDVQIITDAVSSRTLENKNIGIKKRIHE
jgi:hypothetical protein